MEKKRRPWIGFAGMILLLVGLCMAVSGANGTSSATVAVIGGVILVFALITGNAKLFG